MERSRRKERGLDIGCYAKWLTLHSKDLQKGAQHIATETRRLMNEPERNWLQ